jgi:hypothetical protein
VEIHQPRVNIRRGRRLLEQRCGLGKACLESVGDPAVLLMDIGVAKIERSIAATNDCTPLRCALTVRPHRGTRAYARGTHSDRSIQRIADASQRRNDNGQVASDEHIQAGRERE